MTADDVRFPWEEPDDAGTAAAPARGEGDGPARDQGEDATPHVAAQAPPPGLDARSVTVDAAPDGETAGAPSDAAAEEADGDAPTAGDHEAGSSSDAAAARDRPIASREYYSISEVCDLVDLKPHVLRYWETQFPVLNPSKNRSGNRVYQRKEIKLIQLVKHLLYDEKYTVEGAKQRLERMRRGGELPAATAAALDGQTLALLRTELRRLAELLTPPDPA